MPRVNTTSQQVGMVDRDLANHDAVLAAKVQVVSGLDVRLALIETEAGDDKYHVLQGLKDSTVEGDPNCYYCYQRWGGTGTRGQIKVDGPMLQPNVAASVARVFKEKTGADWGSLAPGDRALPGKYWLQQQATPDLSAKWEYYVSDGVDHKPTGWYPYDRAASEEVEEIYAQHVANACESRTACRVVSSGRWNYNVDLTKMTQKNTTTGKLRTIRRATGNEQGSMAVHPKMRGRKRAMKRAPPMKVMKLVSMKKKSRSMKATETGGMKSDTKKSLKVMKMMKKAKTRIGSKSQVLKGLKLKTKGGLRASDLMKNKSGKVVSKRRHAAGRKAYEKNLATWVNACTRARKELHLTGFVAIKRGTDVYNRAKAFLSG